MMILTNDNYFSKEANLEYCGSSQFKDFFGSIVAPEMGCEHRALAKLHEKWEGQKSDALLIGSYVDSHFEGTLDLFKAHHPELFKKDGTLYAKYAQADEIIANLEKDELFMQYMSGEKQVIMTGDIDGVPFKIKIDSYHPKQAIVDLKVMGTITKKSWTKKHGKVSFVQYWGYDIQGAIYQEIVRQNTGDLLPFFIAAATKESVMNKEIIYIDNYTLDNAMKHIRLKLDRLKELKQGVAPKKCGICDYCKSTKELYEAVHYLDIEEE